MARSALSPEAELLEKQIIETLRAGFDKPESFSDWQGCARALIRMFEVKRRPLGVDLEEGPHGRATVGTMTYGEAYNPAMGIQGQEEADAYFEKLVLYLVDTTSKSRREAAEIVRGNLAYWAGYYDQETRARVERLFRCAHPVFGAIAEKGAPTPEQAFAAGVEWASRTAR